MSALAVIPTVVLAGPLALLAALFPAACAGLALFWRRWAILLAVASLASALWFAHGWLRGHADGAWWGTWQALWLGLGLVAGAGALVSLERVRRTWWRGELARLTPGRMALPACLLASLAGIVIFAYALYAGVLWRWPWRECLPLIVAAWAGTLVLIVTRWYLPGRPGATAATEGAMLAALATGCLLVNSALGPRPQPQVVWTFEALERGVILSTPLVAHDRVYVSAVHGTGLTLFGAVYCLDRTSGKRLWTFDNDKRMKQVFSSPAVGAGRLYVGEGLHEDSACRLYCLDAATGREIWSFVTRSHTESSPRLAHGCVYFGAGDDGVYCLDAATGAERWHFPGLHVDTTPAIIGSSLFAGSGYGSSQMFCLDTATGTPRWRMPSDLSVFGSATVAGEQVFFGIGNGKLNRSDPQPAGAVVCLDAATGTRQWRHDVPDAVLGAPAEVGENVYFGSRDRHVYCLKRSDGSLRWRKDLGSPVVAAPVVVEGRLWALGSGGHVYCLDATSGAIVWQFDTGTYSRTRPEMVGTPAWAHETAGTRLYVAGGLHYGISSAATVYCLKVPEE